MAEPATDYDLTVDDKGTPVNPAYRDDKPASLDELTSRNPADKGLLDDLTTLQKRKMETDTAVEDRTMSRLDADRADMERWHARTGQSIDDVKPWNADAERKKYEYNPIDAFGSFASVFAIAASAFTKAPAENALNGAAAAMNAVRAGDDQAYERAYIAWKDNNQLAIRRGEMMHQQYSDALQIMDTDYKRGALEMQTAARRFGDQQVLTMLEHGYNEQAFELIKKRADAVAGLAKADEAITETTVRKQVFDNEVKGLDSVKDPVARAGYTLDAFNRVYGHKQMTNPALEAMGMVMHEHGPGTKDPWTAEQLVEYAEKHGLLPYARSRGSAAGQQAQLIEDETKHNIELGMDDLSAREDAIRKVTALKAVRTPSRDQMQTVDEKAQEIKAKAKAEGRTISDADAKIQATRDVKMATATPSGNRIDQLQSRVDQIKYADEIIGNVEGLLKKHNAITGLGGRITRPAEVLSDVVGSNATDRAQFRRFIEELQLLAPRILTDSQGRPLGAEASHVGSIIAGLNLGDTVANTTRAMQELKKQLAEMSTDTKKRMQGGDTPSAPADSGVPRWMQAPKVQ